ncbi:hypothetical protein D047_5016 [Vibrio parahaemolyticus VPTS-2010_2]|nr:hypothetical protein D047_5016 [Vibrio parahaemolyticus VPTS-2010_2]
MQILILLKSGSFACFSFCQLALKVSFQFGSCLFGFSVLSHEFCAIFQYLGVYQRL